MTTGLAKDSVETKNVGEDVVKEDDGYVQFLLVEDTESRLHVVAEGTTSDGFVRSSEPVGEEEGASEDRTDAPFRRQGLTKLFVGDPVQQGIRPRTFLVRHQAIREETKTFMGPQANERRETRTAGRSGPRGIRCQDFVQGTSPASQFTRGVHIVGVLVRRKVTLGLFVHGTHGLGEGRRMAPEGRCSLQRCPRHRAVDLTQGQGRREVDLEEGSVAEEAMGEWHTARVCRWITGTDDLYLLDADPPTVLGSPEATPFHQ